MRRIVNSTYISLDGDQERLDRWHFEHWSDDLAAYASELLFSADALLMGRLTYEGFAPAWSSREGEVADRMNDMPKYVVSSTLRDPDWTNTTVVAPEDAIETIAGLKAQPGDALLTYGFGPLARTLLVHRLLDEVRFWVHPVLAGGGELNRDGLAARFTLTDTRTFDTGIVVLTYEPRLLGSPPV